MNSGHRAYVHFFMKRTLKINSASFLHLSYFTGILTILKNLSVFDKNFGLHVRNILI